MNKHFKDIKDQKNLEETLLKSITKEINDTHPEVHALYRSKLSLLPQISINYPNTYKSTQITLNTTQEIILSHHDAIMKSFGRDTAPDGVPHLELKISLEDPTFLQQIHNTIKTILEQDYDDQNFYNRLLNPLKRKE